MSPKIPFLFLFAFASLIQGEPLGLVLPTKNDAIFGPVKSDFYMYTNRSFNGVPSRPWQAGKWGFVRTPVPYKDSLIYLKFHEGIDIKPVDRDERGEPLDTIHAIADGKVVHVSSVSGRSNYGKYLVIRHQWKYGAFYSLYAHLSKITIEYGKWVKAGDELGLMGYTGRGLDRVRAHLHLEFGVVLTTAFGTWHKKHSGGNNYHGIYNGLNLCGMDIGDLYLAHKENPDITVPEYIASREVYYKVAVPYRGTFDLIKRHPWLRNNKKINSSHPSWEISLSASGVPLKVETTEKKVSKADVTWVKNSSAEHSWQTRKRISGRGSSAKLTYTGYRFVQLLTSQF